MIHPTVVINVVALSESLLGEHAPELKSLRERCDLRRLRPSCPAVTCTVQSSMLTGKPVREHGIVGNGWYDRALNEIQFWKQSNRLVQAEKVWDEARERDARFTCANMFWWFNMYSSAEIGVTPRPMYKADGRKIPDIYTEPPELRISLQERFGRFPLFNFWGPASSIASSKWIADASMAVHAEYNPSLLLIYLPHLDYALQKFGPNHAESEKSVREIDTIVGELIRFFDNRGVRIVLLSEYGIEPVNQPIEINRILRRSGYLRVRVESGGEFLDPGASDAFAVVDHQVAHVYIRDAHRFGVIAQELGSVPGVDLVLDRSEQRRIGIDHDRAGDLVLIAERGYWFTYHYWLDDARAPDFARTVDIHRKPGYDPLELFLDPNLTMVKLRIAMKVLQRKLGFRMLLDVIPLDSSLVKGSHGRVDLDEEYQPILMTERGRVDGPELMPCESVRAVVLDHLFND